jgi:hypothetical protein
MFLQDLSIVFLLIILISIVLFALRKVYEKKIELIFEKISNDFVKKNKKMSAVGHATIVLLGLILSTSIYIITFKLYSPHFSLNLTTSINWYTIHKYPRQQDYFYFFSSFIFVLVSTCIFWFLIIWKKRTK